MIKSATFKLTLWYLGIIMVLSSLFSVALYRESTAQLNENIGRQRSSVTRLPLPPEYEPRRTEFLQALDDQLGQGQQRILLRLLALNLATLVLGGAAAYAAARRTLRPIESAMEAQGRFTADASHELRTPLTAMRAEIEVALRQKQLAPAEARELLGSNLEEIAKLEALSAGLLRLARSGDRLDPSAIKSVPVHAVFAGATRRLEKPLAARHISVKTTVGEETVAGDLDSLVELFAILLDNAMKYGPDHSAIELVSEPAAHAVRLSVIDHGIGIPAQDLPHIFDRFYRADQARSRDGSPSGYGLGLSIAQRIVDLHGGTISAESVSGHGATLRVKLPLEPSSRKTLAG